MQTSSNWVFVNVRGGPIAGSINVTFLTSVTLLKLEKGAESPLHASKVSEVSNGLGWILRCGYAATIGTSRIH